MYGSVSPQSQKRVPHKFYDLDMIGPPGGHAHRPRATLSSDWPGSSSQTEEECYYELAIARKNWERILDQAMASLGFVKIDESRNRLATLFAVTPAGTINPSDMIERIVAIRHGKEWVKPIEFLQDQATGKIEIRGGAPDPDPGAMVRIFGEAEGLLLSALGDATLIAEVELDGRPYQIPAIFWKTGAGFVALKEREFEGRPFWVSRAQCDPWLARLPKPAGRVPSTAPDAGEALRLETSSETKRGAPKESKRETRRRVTVQKYETWHQLALKYGYIDGREKRNRDQIAKKVAADPAAKDPENKKVPDWQTVKRRLNTDCPGWAEESWARKPGTKILPAATI